MLLTEYNEKKHLKNTYREGVEDGLAKGREEKLKEQIQKKLSKGKSISMIADELEEDPLIIEQFISDHNLPKTL